MSKHDHQKATHVNEIQFHLFQLELVVAVKSERMWINVEDVVSVLAATQ